MIKYRIILNTCIYIVAILFSNTPRFWFLFLFNRILLRYRSTFYTSTHMKCRILNGSKVFLYTLFLDVRVLTTSDLLLYICTHEALSRFAPVNVILKLSCATP